jgi:GNAT superfamily N-acetyltransferase
MAMMRLSIAPITQEHLAPAAALLAEHGAALRERDPRLPASYADRDGLAAALANEPGVANGDGAVAWRGERLAGVLLAKRLLLTPTDLVAEFYHPRSVEITQCACSPDEPDPTDVYRRLYAVAAARWVRDGFFVHYVWSPAIDEVAQAAWFSLGFGQDVASCLHQLRNIPDSAPPHGVELRAATLEDAEQIEAVVLGITAHHCEPPMFFPLPREVDEDALRFIKASLAQTERGYGAFVAVRDGRVIAVVFFDPTGLLRPGTDGLIYLLSGVTDPAERGTGVGTALVHHALREAVSAGFSTSMLLVLTSNIGGYKFWRETGFEPLEYRLGRRIDERIAWAKP